MSLFIYKVTLEGGKTTAKTEADARKQVAMEHKVADWISIKEQPAPQTKKTAQKPPLTKLKKMLYLQHGRCFFCGEILAEKDATIEHLVPKAHGGGSLKHNEVVCHASLNHTFADMDIKRKMEFVLQSAGKFKCPKV